jgi:hypothetical protein
MTIAMISPKSKIIPVGMNLILRMNFHEIFNYKVGEDEPLPTGQP